MKKNLYLLIILYGLAVVTGILILVSKPKLKVGYTLAGKDSIAIVKIRGPIEYSQFRSFLFAEDAEKIIKKIRKFSQKSDVKGILLVINSPGGTVSAVQSICEEIKRAKKGGKKIFAAAQDICCSGGYYIASVCDKIVANPGSLIGSIGVILEIANVEDLFKKIGLKMTTIKSGRYKDIGSPFRKLTEEERVMFQKLVDEAYNQFLNTVIEERKLTQDLIPKISEGGIYTGSQAFEFKLIDFLGDEFVAIEELKKSCNIKDARIIEERDVWDKFRRFFGGSGEEAVFRKFLGKNRIRFEYIFE